MLPELITEIPGPESGRLAAQIGEYESRNVTFLADDWPVFWERAEGVNVWDVDGNRFLDFTAAFAVAGLGHGRTEVVESAAAQAGQLLHGMGDVHPSRPKADLCRRLSELTFERWGAGRGKTVLSNAGFEAVETALKTAVLATGRPGVVAFEGGYHGLGYGALLPAGFEKFRGPFAGQLADVAHRLPFPVDHPELEAVRNRLEEIDAAAVGAVVVEPIQGRGGIVIPPPGFLALLREWCDRAGALLVFDEIYTGFQRTGRWFACEHEGIVPDLICLGKALSGGFPISACVGKASVMDAWPPSTGEALHTSTFLGHPVGCAMALESLRLHQLPATAEQVAACGARMEAVLKGLAGPGIRAVRGCGAMWALEFAAAGAGAAAARRLLADGILLLPAGPHGEVLAFTPPFGIGEGEIDFLGSRLQAVI